MRRLSPLLLLLLVPCVLFPGALPGPRVVSADDHLSVHHAFQDEAGGGRVHHPHLSDPALQLKALRRRVVSSLERAQAPLWNPDLYGGAPLLADGQSQPASPVTWTRLLLPEDLAQDLGVYWTLAWTGIGAALLLRAMGIGAWAATTGGAAVMLGPYPVVWLLHPHASTFCWLPFVLLGVETRRGWLVALAVAGMAGGGHPGSFVHGMGIAGAWWLVRRRSAETAAGVLVGLLLAGPLLWPLYEQAQRSTTLNARGTLPLAPRQLLDLVWPGLLGHPARESWQGPGAWADGQLHPGLPALLLGLLAARTSLGRGLLLGWVGLLGLALLPLPGPFAHGRLGSEGALLLGLAAGVGASTIRTRHPAQAPALLLLVVLGGLHARRSDQHSLPAEAHDPEPAAWTRELVEQVGDGRVLGLGWALQPNTGALLGLRDLRGYDLPVSTDTHRLMAALNRPPKGPWYPVESLPSLPLLRFAGVRIVLTVPEQPLDLEEIPLDDAPLRAWRVPDPLPRAWVAGDARVVADPRRALEQLSADAEAGARPTVEALPAGWKGDGREPQLVPVSTDGDSRLILSLEGDREGLLVLNDAWAPGWRARVDGRPRAVLRVGGAFRGVLLKKGEKTVELRYRPAGWILGLRALLAGLAGPIVLFVLAGRRRGRVREAARIKEARHLDSAAAEHPLETR